MRPKRRAFLFQSIAACLAPGLAQAAPTAMEILKSTDRVRAPQEPFTVMLDLTEYVSGRPRDKLTLRIYSRLESSTGQFQTLARYVSPPRDNGKLVLFNGSNMWFYDPASRATVRLSPQQRLIGQAANGDVVTSNWSRDYLPTIGGTESLEDANRVQRNCWRLDLKGATSSAVYARVEVWIEQGTFAPIKAKFYADSGRLLKIAYYRRFAPVLGVSRPTETVIIDGLDPNSITTMVSTAFAAQPIPQEWFDREFLPQIPNR